jgi:hypothetical protein
MAPEVGLEPTTSRLTAGCSTIELLWNPKCSAVYYLLSVANRNSPVNPEVSGLCH